MTRRHKPAKINRPWFACPVEAWPHIVPCLTRPFEEEVAIADLRYLADQVSVGRLKRLPGRPALAKRWGWTQRKVRNILENDWWRDVAKSAASPGPVSGQFLPEVDQHLPETASRAPSNLNNEPFLARSCQKLPEVDQHLPEVDQSLPAPVPYIRARDTELHPPQHRPQTTDTKHLSYTREPAGEREPIVLSSGAPTTELAVADVVVAEARRAPALSHQPISKSTRHPYDADDLVQALGAAASAITGQPWCPDGDATGTAHTIATLRGSKSRRGEGWPLFALLEARGWPDLRIWLEQVQLVALAARECPAPIFSNDIRGEAWATKSNTCRSIRDLAQPNKWLQRLRAAVSWAAAEREQASPTPTLVSAAELLAGTSHRDLFGLLKLSAAFECHDPQNLLNDPQQLSQNLLDHLGAQQ